MTTTSRLSLNHIPRDSILRHFVTLHQQTEVPLNFLMAVGLSVVGLMLRRNVWVRHMSDQTLIMPNLSVMLVGDSGCGKDTAINFGRRWLYDAGLSSLLLGGRTIEGIYAQLVERNPAIGFLPLGEMTATIGKKDYQQGIVEGLTDLLSGNPEVDVSTKGNPSARIHWPTLTVYAGSTVEWLHKAMPDGALEGGFLGRFYLAIKSPEESRALHPLPAYELVDVEERAALVRAKHELVEGSRRLIEWSRGRGNTHVITEAQDLYQNWYYNRFGYFSKTASPYAKRCRDTVLKLALLSAMSRQALWIEPPDIELGIAMLQDTASKIDKLIVPQTRESQCAEAVLRALPASRSSLIKTLRQQFYWREIQQVLQQLDMSGEIELKGTTFIRK